MCLVVPARGTRNAAFVHQAVGGIKQAGNEHGHNDNNLNNVSEIALFLSKRRREKSTRNAT